MNIFSYEKAIRIFAIGIVILFVGIGINKGLGVVDFGVTITFLGFGVCVIGMSILAVFYIKKLFS